MMPSSPMRGRLRVASALSVDVLVAMVERIDVLFREGDGFSKGAREVDGARDVLAHHRRLDRGAGVGPEGEHAVIAKQHGGRAVRSERLDDRAADLLVADARE